MEEHDVVMVRIYLTEGRSRLSGLLEFLRDEGLRGATVYRAIAGFGPSGVVHTSTFADLSLDLPLTVEFYDRPERVQAVLPDLCRRFDPDHIVQWRAAVLAPLSKDEGKP